MENWWNNYPWRMIQTNLRDIDMEDIDAVSYARELKNFGATVVTLNAGGIIASYDSKLPYQPNCNYLHGDSLSEIIEACHQEGIRVIARTDFSKILESVYMEHPDWAYKTKDGEIVNYNGYVHTCPNGDYQQKYMFDILEEIFTSFDFDGLFLNMGGFLVVDYSGKYYGPCHCENCQRKFKDQHGLDLPREDNPRSADYKKYAIFKKVCEKTQTKKIHQKVKSINPNIAINKLDYTRSESNTDITRLPWLYSASSNSRMNSGTNREKPVDNASVDFMAFRYRQISVSPDLMALRQWQNLANAGSLSMYIMGTLGNHRDTSGFGPTQKVFQFHKEHHAHYANLKSAAKVLVMRKPFWQKDPEVYGWIQALTESHIPFDEMRMADFADKDQLEGKEIIILGDMKIISADQASIIDEFAANGGTVIATGETGLLNSQYEVGSNLALECLGVETIKGLKRDLMSSMLEIQDDERDLFPRCQETPFIAIGPQMLMAKYKDNSKFYMNLVPEHPFGPPEICYHSEVTSDPGIVVTPYGKGKGVYVPWGIGTIYQELGYKNPLNVIQDIMFSLCQFEDLAPDLTPMVELNLARSEKGLMLQIINMSGVFTNRYHQPLPIYDIDLQVQFKDGLAYEVYALNGGNTTADYNDGKLKIKLDRLNEYEAIIIEEKE